MKTTTAAPGLNQRLFVTRAMPCCGGASMGAGRGGGKGSHRISLPANTTVRRRLIHMIAATATTNGVVLRKSDMNWNVLENGVSTDSITPITKLAKNVTVSELN